MPQYQYATRLISGIRGMLGCLLCVFISLSVCMPNAAAQSAPRGKTTLAVGVLPFMEELPLLVSATEMAMPLLQTSVTLEKFTSWTALEAAFRTGMIDAAGMPITKALVLAAEAIPLKIVSLLHRGGTGIALSAAAAQNSNGTLIGVTGNQVGQLSVLSRFVARQNLVWGMDVRYILVPFDRAIELMRQERLNGFVLSEPYLTMARRQGVAPVIIAGKDIAPDFVDVVAVINPAVIARSPAVVKEWVDSIHAAGRYIENDRQRTGGRQIALLQHDKFGFSPELFQEALTTDQSVIRFDRLRIDDSAISEAMRQAIALDILAESVDIPSIVDRQFE